MCWLWRRVRVAPVLGQEAGVRPSVHCRGCGELHGPTHSQPSAPHLVEGLRWGTCSGEAEVPLVVHLDSEHSPPSVPLPPAIRTVSLEPGPPPAAAPSSPTPKLHACPPIHSSVCLPLTSVSTLCHLGWPGAGHQAFWEDLGRPTGSSLPAAGRQPGVPLSPGLDVSVSRVGLASG